jgi:hypothetical protein
MTLQECKQWIEKQNFVEAKSYAKTFPHYYTLREWCDELEFEEFIRCIRTYGKLKQFHKKQYLYLEINSFEYWEMGRPIKAVQVLNKAIINDFAKYRINANPDDEALLKSKLQDREYYLENLLNKDIKTDTDIKQISFLMNTTRKIHGGGKNIIDNAKIKITYE